MIRVGVISDTHRLVRAEALAVLEGSDLIIHAGDIGSIQVIERLRLMAPVKAIRGNVDTGGWADEFPSEAVVELGGKRLYVLHNRRDLKLNPKTAGFDGVISGHSHMPKREWVDGVLFLNPGSAGPRRFKLPVAVATLIVAPSGLRATIHELAV